MGARCEIEHGLVKLIARKLTGAHIYLDVVSVGATVNLMLAAAGAEGRTVLENAAKEPEIVDLANFLNAMGAVIKGAGTDVIKIDGVKHFGGAEHAVIPDRIEAGTFMLAAVATGGDLVIGEVIPKHLEAVTAKLREIGAEVDVEPEQIRVRRTGPLTPSDLKTFPYPGFPTDLQPLGMVLLTAAEGTSIITENVFDGRFRHVDELKRMGAQIKLEGRTAVINGGSPLSGAPVTATDLRAGAALIVAGLIAKGDTVLSEVEHIYRGYEKIEEKLTALGAQLKPVSYTHLDVYKRQGPSYRADSFYDQLYLQRQDVVCAEPCAGPRESRGKRGHLPCYPRKRQGNSPAGCNRESPGRADDPACRKRDFPGPLHRQRAFSLAGGRRGEYLPVF